MKKIILISLILTSCNSRVDKTICGKKYTTYGGNPMPAKICRFFYNNYSREFQYSCHFYSIGDTVKFKIY